VASKIGSLLISLGLESGALSSGLSAAEKQVRAASKRIAAVGQTMQGVGQKMSLAVTIPLVALGKASVAAAMESRDALAQVDTALKSMGSAAGRTSEQLQALASSQMKQSLFDDDEILRKVTANLLTFGNVAGAEFDRAQMAAIDLATRMGTDLQSATIMIGKALNDPVKGLAALRRVGIQFTDQQESQIKAMVAVGNAAGAQGVMLAELERQFGGSAAAARKANPFAVLKQSFNELQEVIGDKLLTILPNVIAPIERLLTAFSSLSPGMQQSIVTFGLIAAAAGPVITVLGAIVSATAPFTAALSVIAGSGGIMAAVSTGFAGLAAALGPVLVPLAAVAAAGALIYANWDKIAPVLEEFWASAKMALGPEIQQLVNTLSATFSELWNGPLGAGIRAAGTALLDFSLAYGKVMGPALIFVLEQAIGAFTNLAKMVGDAVRIVSALLSGDFRGALEAAASLANRVFFGIPEVVGKMVTAVRDWLIGKLGAVFDGLKAKIEQVKGYFFGLYDAVVGHSYIPDMVDGIAAQMARLDAVLVNPAKNAAAKTTAAFRKLAEDVAPILDRLFPEAAAKNAFDKDFAAIEAAGKGGLLNRGQTGAALDRLQGEFFAARPDNDNAPAAIAGWDAPLAGMRELTTEMARFSAQVSASIPVLGSLNGVFDRIGIDGAELKDDLARSFTDIITGAQSFGDAMRGVFNRLTTKILDNMINNLLGNLLGGIIPGFAGGTNFAPGGLALVGERGPELVNLPRGSQVHTAGATAQMLQQGSGINLTVNVTGAMNDRAARETGAQVGRAALRTINGPLKRAG